MATTVEPAKKWNENVREYVGDLRTEMRRVTWPSQKQVQSTTAVVIVTVFFFAAYFFVVDKVIDQTVTRLYAALVK